MLLVKTGDGVPIDIAFGGLPFEEKMVQRVSEYDLAERVLITTCSAEDLIVLKAFAGRDKDWMDIKGILVRQGNKIDFDQVFPELSLLADLKEEPELVEKLKSMKDTLLK